MSETIYHRPDAPIEYTIPTAATRVQRVGGHPPTSRRPQPAGDTDTDYNWRGIQYTGPVGTVYRPGRQPPARTATRDASDHRHAQRRAEPAAARRRNPDLALYATVVPYNRKLRDIDGGWLEFDTDTEWQHAAVVPIEIEHGGTFVGHAEPINERHGLTVLGTIYAGLRQRVADRNQLSISIDSVDTTPLRDGTLHVNACRLEEVSLCERGAWQIDAITWQQTA